jgi:hypothetical protein
MAQTGYTPISIYYSATATNTPTAGNLVAGELAINTADGKLFYKDSAGVVQVIAGKGGAGVAGGSTTQVQYNSSGSLAGSANMTFSGTALTLANDASISGLTVGKGGGSIGTNTTVGANTLTGNTTGARNTAIGGGAGASNTTGNGLTALGYNTLANNTTGSGNIAIGGSDVSVGGAMQANTTGSSNVAVGTAALGTNSTGSSNTAIGYSALVANTTASNNTAVGYQAGYSNTTTPHNTFLGNVAGYSTITNGYNTFVGSYAGYSVTTGTQNTFLGVTTTGGYGAGYLVTTGSKNTIIGAYNGNQGSLDIRTASNYIVLSDGDGNPKYYTNGTTHTLATSASTEGTAILALGGNWGTMYWAGYGQDTANSANASLKLGKAANGRSINAGGTFNANGADYAEYMVKAGTFTIAKGDICGIDANGKLTNVFADAISFVVKSSDPSFVGGDKWGVGLEPNSQELEVARQTVDRIAFAGQVPVNVTNATVGQYIIPINNNGEINGQAISNPAFEQYLIAVGKVISVDLTGKPTIIVKVA